MATNSQGSGHLKPKNSRRKSVTPKPKRRSTIESVVNTILPSIGTGPSAGYSLPEVLGGQGRESKNRAERQEEGDLARRY